MWEGIKRIRRTQGGAGKTIESFSSFLRQCETIRYCGMDTFVQNCRDLVLFGP